MQTLKRIMIILLSAFAGAFLGMKLYSAFADNQPGFVGSAMLFWTGVIGMVVGIVAGWSSIKKLDHKQHNILLAGLFILTIIIIGWVTYRMSLSGKANEVGSIDQESPSFFSAVSRHDHIFIQKSDSTMGMGLAKPGLSDQRKLYFYQQSSPSVSEVRYVVFDSLLISLGSLNYQIDYAPAWFYPEHLKLDYDIFYLKTKTITRNYLEVIGNKITGQTIWIDSESAEYLEWPGFLLNVYAVSMLDPVHHPIKAKPVDNASVVKIQDLDNLTLQPIAIQGEWMEVLLVDNDDKPISKGWIRWKKNDRMLISYSLLS
ncbi:MAG: hypothetical protein IPG82_07140 [Saprospiraceae bacterium]|nr:hypothetical protein [Saprospiraceae bacterium]